MEYLIRFWFRKELDDENFPAFMWKTQTFSVKNKQFHNHNESFIQAKIISFGNIEPITNLI